MFRWLEKRLADHRLSQQMRQQTRQLYDGIVAQARHADFYRRLQAPDTLRGRFELLAMHMYLVLDRLRTAGGDACNGRAQDLVDIMFDDMDDVARELGVGDMGVGPRVKKLARSFRSRLEAYEQAVGDADDGRLALVVGEILFDNDGERLSAAAQLAAYLRRQRSRLAARPAEELLAGAVPGLFGAPVEETGDDPA